MPNQSRRSSSQLVLLRLNAQNRRGPSGLLAWDGLCSAQPLTVEPTATTVAAGKLNVMSRAPIDFPIHPNQADSACPAALAVHPHCRLVPKEFPTCSAHPRQNAPASCCCGLATPIGTRQHQQATLIPPHREGTLLTTLLGTPPQKLRCPSWRPCANTLPPPISAVEIPQDPDPLPSLMLHKFSRKKQHSWSGKPVICWSRKQHSCLAGLLRRSEKPVI